MIGWGADHVSVLCRTVHWTATGRHPDVIALSFRILLRSEQRPEDEESFHDRVVKVDQSG